ncbi:MAG TPA: Fe(2+)-trafficking protein [Tepidisphaeraceae bacterium]|nr:Fe(2+)-trafficking protein [Tepidisphaeraceae bacterium]
MTDSYTRIENFRKMANDDPDNELGHFSLGRAYLDAGMLDGAIAAFERVIQLNPTMSRAYQLVGTALLKKGQRDLAIERLTQGIQTAHARGDLMPKREMIEMLQDLNVPVPELTQAVASRPVGEGEVFCQRCHQIGPKLPARPFSNALGQRIQDNICQPCWREWITMGTKVINELRLPMSDPQAQKVFDQHMLEFLNLE